MGEARMRAAVARGARELAVERIERPEPGEGQVRVRVSACGLCGTDLHFHHLGLYPPGLVPGHEIAGRVDALGPGVEGIELGCEVAVEPLLSCGSCPACRAGRDSICPQVQVLGLHRSGGMAEWITVPARRVFPLRDPLAPELAALAEPMAVVVHGLERGGFEPGQRVLVLGAGAIGLLAVVAARALGAGEVWISARHPHQADRARALGAARVLGENEATPEALAAEGRAAPVDLVIESVGGNADTLRAAAAAIRPGGAISVLGLFFGPMALDAFPLLLKEGTLAWSNCYAHPEEGADFERALALIAQERDALADLVTHRVPLDRVEEAYQLAAEKRSGAVKVSVLP